MKKKLTIIHIFQKYKIAYDNSKIIDFFVSNNIEF